MCLPTTWPEDDLPEWISFPYKIGYDCAGTVIEIGPGVTRFKVGDAVYVRLPEASRGIVSSRRDGRT